MASCKCKCGHVFSARVIEDDPDTNSITLSMDVCPECGSDEFTIIEIEDSFELSNGDYE